MCLQGGDWMFINLIRGENHVRQTVVLETYVPVTGIVYNVVGCELQQMEH